MTEPKPGATREPNETEPRTPTETGGGSSPPAPDQVPDFDADFETEHAHFRKHMDRYFGDLERIVDAEPVGDGAGGAGRTPVAAGGEPKATKPAKAPEIAPSPPGPASRSWRDTLFGVSKSRRS